MAKGGSLNVAEIYSEIALKEGKKVETTHGNIREIGAIISDMIYADLKDFTGWEGGQRGVVTALYLNGERRAKARKAKRR